MAAAGPPRSGSTASPTRLARATTRRRPAMPTATTRWCTTPRADRPNGKAALGATSAPLFLLALLGGLRRAQTPLFPPTGVPQMGESALLTGSHRLDSEENRMSQGNAIGPAQDGGNFALR